MSSSAEFDLHPIPVIVGPTAVGKTQIALDLARRFDLEIISCDSRQIYKYLNIGTAKPTPEVLQGTPYHLIDFVEPDEIFSAVKYRTAAEERIEAIWNGGKIPLIVGGTGLYLKALTSGFFATPDADWTYRNSLADVTNSDLHSKLKEIDPDSASEIPVNNRVRVIRALEITKLTGRTKSELKGQGEYPKRKHDFIIFELNCYREKLYQFINSRVDRMILGGLVAEVESLIALGYRDSPVLAKTVGYRETLDYLASGKADLNRCVELIKQHSRNYAKRQITWFKGIKDRVVIDLEQPNWREFLFEEIHKLKLDTYPL